MHFVCFVIIPKSVYVNEVNNEPEAWIQGHNDEMIEKNMDRLAGFDWYVIGGRWNGMLIRNYKSPQDGVDYCYVDRIEDNWIAIKDLSSLYKDHYLEAQPDLITSDGQFYDGHPSYNKAISFDEYLDILKKETGNYVVNIDYHC